MNVISSSYQILTPISKNGIDELKHIEKIARVCYKSEDKITMDGESAKKLIRNLINAKPYPHEAMLEHSMLSVKFTVDRGVTHELVRHRVASFAQESTRYCNYAKTKFGNEINVINPASSIQYDAAMNKLPAETIGNIIAEWLNAMRNAEASYMKLIELGASPQFARSVLPNSTKADITVTANYREWRHFFQLRTDPSAHPQMREIAIPLLNDLKSKIPVIFDDILPVDGGSND